MSPSSKYMKIADELRVLIAEGVYPPGSKIPPLPDLMKAHGVARETVRNAIALLSQEGLLVPGRGIGTVVRDTSPIALVYVPGKTAPLWQGENKLVSAHRERADIDIAQRLHLPADLTTVIYRVRHQSRDGQMVQIHEQWIPAGVADAIKDVTGCDVGDIASPQKSDVFSLMTEAGRPPAWITERQQARLPYPDERETLFLPPTIPVLVTYRVTVDSAETPLEASTFVAAGDRTTTSYTIPVER